MGEVCGSDTPFAMVIIDFSVDYKICYYLKRTVMTYWIQWFCVTLGNLETNPIQNKRRHESTGVAFQSCIVCFFFWKLSGKSNVRTIFFFQWNREWIFFQHCFSVLFGIFRRGKNSSNRSNIFPAIVLKWNSIQFNSIGNGTEGIIHTDKIFN